jgi:CRISPR-associated protein Csx3
MEHSRFQEETIMAQSTHSIPAILIGGPPHSGKSVLVYGLTRALRARDAAHYVLRACPDGEGDWSNEGDQILVRSIRRKGEFTPAFTARVADYLRRRHLPLLVDVGGRPKDDQLGMFALCTHAILLVGRRRDNPQAYDHDRALWLDYLTKAGLSVIADLQSDLEGQNDLLSIEPVVRGAIAGLERGRMVEGSVFDALVDQVATLCGTWEAMEPDHLAAAPAAATLLNLPQLNARLGGRGVWWEPEQVPTLLEYVNGGEAVAIYGRAPGWVYAALAVHAQPAPVWIFDVRYGWMALPVLPVGKAAEPQEGWATEVRAIAVGNKPAVRLELMTTSQYLDPDEPEGLPLPRAAGGMGLVLSGKAANWMLLGAARQLGAGRPWLAVYQPQLNGAVVIRSAAKDPKPGDVLPV